jgi:hypothetical protein
MRALDKRVVLVSNQTSPRVNESHLNDGIALRLPQPRACCDRTPFICGCLAANLAGEAFIPLLPWQGIQL